MLLPIPMVDGEKSIVILPDSLDDPDGMDLLNSAAHEVCLELARRKALRQKTIVSEWLRPLCYRFICHFYDQGLMPLFSKRLSNYSRFTNNDEVFSYGLSAIFAEDAANFTGMDRLRYGRQLYYAFRHYVPWEFVYGFLLTLEDFENKKNLTTIEDGFEEWIVRMRSLAQTDTYMARGRYPKEIEEKVLIVRSEYGALIFGLPTRARNSVRKKRG